MKSDVFIFQQVSRLYLNVFKCRPMILRCMSHLCCVHFILAYVSIFLCAASTGVINNDDGDDDDDDDNSSLKS